MAFLFVVENNIAKPNTETLLISPYKEIWERDSSEDKGQAIKEFTFIEFMCSKKASNPYAGFDDVTRFERLKESLFSEDWEMDNLIEKALIQMREFQTEASVTYSYYISSKIAAEKMQAFFLNFNMNERNERTGLPIFKPRDITSALKDTEDVLNRLNSMKEKVEQELFEQTKTKGNKTINPFEM